jgi:hypothetical protein
MQGERKGGSFVVFRGIIFDDPPVVRGYFGLYPSSTTGGGTGLGREGTKSWGRGQPLCRSNHSHELIHCTPKKERYISNLLDPHLLVESVDFTNPIIQASLDAQSWGKPFWMFHKVTRSGYLVKLLILRK